MFADVQETSCFLYYDEDQFSRKSEGCDTMRRTVHQWRDWLLEYIGDDKYELIEKATLSVFRTIVAKNAMDAENECQLIIKNSKENSA
jgi:hypothetical protein